MTEQSDVDRFRDHLRVYDGGKNADLAERPDDVLQEAIDGAKAWIGGRRMSWHVVATNYLRHGTYRP